MSPASGFDALLDSAMDAFGAAARDAGLVDVAVQVVPSPVGELLLAATDAGVVRVGFDVEVHERVVAQLAVVSERVVECSTPVLDAASEQLERYFAGELAAFDLPLDLQLSAGPYRREVLEELRRIPLGETRTYAEVAIATGRPRAIRAVGSGCATNPVPLIVPCHRVLRTGGELGGYLGGVERKRWLLELEQRRAS